MECLKKYVDTIIILTTIGGNSIEMLVVINVFWCYYFLWKTKKL